MIGVNILLVFMMGQKGEIAVMVFHFYSDCVSYSDHFSQLKGLINNCFRTWFCNVSVIESALLVHSSLFLLSSSVDSLVRSYRLYVFLWKREVTTQVMSVHGESEDHPGLYWYWSFVKSLAYRRPYAWKSLPQNAHAMSVKLIKLGHFLCAYVTS